MFDTTIPDVLSNTTASIEQTTCILVDGVRETDYDFPIDLPSDLVNSNVVLIESGSLMLKVCGVEIIQDQLIQSSESTFAVVDDAKYRHLSEAPGNSAVGSKTLALISISTLDSVSSHSAQAMADALIDPYKINLFTQFDACSFGKLEWTLAPGGLIDVSLPDTISNLETDTAVVVATQKYLKKTMHLNSVADLADKVIMCIPPGTGLWAGRAGINHWRVQMNDHWCLSLTGTVHELGHTLGLSHSNANGLPYADRSGYMGSGYTSPTWPQKCFNAYHSHQLGWYSDRTITISEQSPNTLIELATFVDYDRLDWNNYVLINLGDKYFMNFNVARSFNVGTEHRRDQLTVTEPTPKGTESIAGLAAGDMYTIANFKGSALIIEACRWAKNTKGADVMVVSISTGQSLCTTNQEMTRVEPNTGTGGERSSSVLEWLLRIMALVRERKQ